LIHKDFVFCFFLRQFGESLDLLTFGLGSTGISTKLSTTSAKAAWRHVLAAKSVCGRGLSTYQGRLVILLKKFVAAFGFS